MEYKDELKDFIKGLHRMADWLEKNGETFAPYLDHFRVDAFCRSPEEFYVKTKLLGKCHSESTDFHLIRRKSFGRFVFFDLNIIHALMAPGNSNSGRIMKGGQHE